MEVDGSRQTVNVGSGRFAGVVTPPLAARVRVAGAIAFLAIAAAYLWLGGSWWVGLALLLGPDLAFLGFAFGPRAGVAAYNAVHRPVVPAALLVIALVHRVLRRGAASPSLTQEPGMISVGVVVAVVMTVANSLATMD
jgi:hypothetical protein